MQEIYLLVAMGDTCHIRMHSSFDPTGRKFWGQGEPAILLEETDSSFLALFPCMLRSTLP